MLMDNCADEVLLRPLTTHDLAACAVIEADSYPTAVCEGLDVFAGKLAHSPRSCWVAVEAGTGGVVGYAIAMPARHSECPVELFAPSGPTDPAADGEDRTLYLHDVSVAPPARRKGVGELLVRQAEEYAAAEGLPTITLTAVCGGSSYWSRHGFSKLTHVSDAARQRLLTYPPECGEVTMMRRDVRPDVR